MYTAVFVAMSIVPCPQTRIPKVHWSRVFGHVCELTFLFFKMNQVGLGIILLENTSLAQRSHQPFQSTTVAKARVLGQIRVRAKHVPGVSGPQTLGLQLPTAGVTLVGNGPVGRNVNLVCQKLGRTDLTQENSRFTRPKIHLRNHFRACHHHSVP